MRSLASSVTSFRVRTIAAAVIESAAGRPDKTAVVLGDETYTYAQLEAHSRRIARGLLALDVDPGDRVAVWLPNSIEWLATAFGVAMTGAVLVPVNLRYRRDEAEYILAQSGARALVFTDKVAGTDFRAMVESIVPEIDRSEPCSLESAALPELGHAI